MVGKVVRIHHGEKFTSNHTKHVKGYMEDLIEEVKIGKSKVFDYDELIATIYDLGYTKFTV